MNYLKNITPYLTKAKRFNNKLVVIGEHFNQKFKGTIVETWMKYWKQLYRDYNDVVIDVKTQSKQRPMKAVGYLSGLGAIWICAKYNPDETNYRDVVVRSINEVILVNTNVQRTSSLEHLRLLEKCYNTLSLRYQSFGIFSIIWVDNFSSQCNSYECHCEYMQVPYTKFFRRIVDIGFLNKWWLLEKHLENYDVNYYE